MIVNQTLMHSIIFLQIPLEFLDPFGARIDCFMMNML